MIEPRKKEVLKKSKKSKGYGVLDGNVAGSSMMKFDSTLLGCKYELVHGSASYERMERSLPILDGVTSLSKIEVKRDLRSIEIFLNNMADYGFGHASSPGMLRSSSRSQGQDGMMLSVPGSGSLQPEEILQALPNCRRAVHLTRDEFLSAKAEHAELESTYMGLRYQLMQHLDTVAADKKAQDKVLSVIRSQLSRKASELDTRKRRNTILQDILLEFESRGDKINTLERDNARLRQLVNPDDSLMSDDTSPTDDTIAIVSTDQKESVPSSFFDHAKKWLLAEESAEGGGGMSTVPGAVAVGADPNTTTTTTTASSYTMAGEQDTSCVTLLNNETHRSNNITCVDFMACTLRNTPAGVPLLVSPLSLLPEKTVCVVGQERTSDTSSSYIHHNNTNTTSLDEGGSSTTMALPNYIKGWEAERFVALEQQGEIIRLRVQLKHAETQRNSAHLQIGQQLDMINQLVLESNKSRHKKDGSNSDKLFSRDMRMSTISSSTTATSSGINHHHNPHLSAADVTSPDKNNNAKRTLRPRAKSPLVLPEVMTTTSTVSSDIIVPPLNLDATMDPTTATTTATTSTTATTTTSTTTTNGEISHAVHENLGPRLSTLSPPAAESCLEDQPIAGGIETPVTDADPVTDSTDATAATHASPLLLSKQLTNDDHHHDPLINISSSNDGSVFAGQRRARTKDVMTIGGDVERTSTPPLSSKPRPMTRGASADSGTPSGTPTTLEKGSKKRVMDVETTIAAARPRRTTRQKRKN